MNNVEVNTPWALLAVGFGYCEIWPYGPNEPPISVVDVCSYKKSTYRSQSEGSHTGLASRSYLYWRASDAIHKVVVSIKGTHNINTQIERSKERQCAGETKLEITLNLLR